MATITTCSDFGALLLVIVKLQDNQNSGETLSNLTFFFLPFDLVYHWKNVTSFIWMKVLSSSFIFLIFIIFLIIIFIVVDFVIHWNETAMGLHVFPMPMPPPTSLSTRSL